MGLRRSSCCCLYAPPAPFCSPLQPGKFPDPKTAAGWRSPTLAGISSPCLTGSCPDALGEREKPLKLTDGAQPSRWHGTAERCRQRLGWEILTVPGGTHSPGAKTRAEQGAREHIQDNTTKCSVGSLTPTSVMSRCLEPGWEPLQAEWWEGAL